MVLTDFLKGELEHYLGIAEVENDAEGEVSWALTVTGYKAILAGEPIPEHVRECMDDELRHQGDRYDGDESYQWYSLIASLGFGSKPKRPGKPRIVEVVRDLDNDGYTIPFTGNRFCGPAALAYLLRTDPGAAAYLLRQASGRKQITGTATHHMLRVLEQYGFDAVPRHHAPKVVKPKFRTFGQWLEIEQPSPTSEYLVVVGNHYVVLHRGQVWDSFFHLGKPIPQCHRKRQRVTSAWLIKKAGL